MRIQKYLLAAFLSLPLLALCNSSIFSAEPKQATTGATKKTAAVSPTTSTAKGILVAKTADSISVKLEGQSESQKFIPLRKDEAFDKEIIATIKKLIVSNLVEIEWLSGEDRAYIVRVQMIVPENKEGTVIGTLAAKAENWIDVKPAEGPTERYMPRWTGGAPAQGGGMDKDMLRAFAELKVGNKVQVKWTYDERKRAVEVTKH